MSKPLGVALGFDRDGDPTMRVVRSSGAEDKVWEAVESWMLAGGSPEHLKREIAAAWKHLAEEAAEDAVRVLRQ